MEIKYTIEILTKDIQDIEKLVANLQNSKDGPAIELDLALSKLRNVYEILTMIKADRLSELINPERLPSQAASTPAPAPESVTEPVAPAAPSKPEPQAVTEPEPEAVPESAPAAVSEPERSPATVPEVEIKSEKKSKDSAILAEKFSTQASINENLAGKRVADVDTKLLGQPIENIGRNIGINDRFLIIRELFDGNADDFSDLVKRLDGTGNYQDAIDLLNEKFSGDMEHEGVGILTGLVKRRYIKQ